MRVPDRPLPPHLRVLRPFVRSVRLAAVRLKQGDVITVGEAFSLGKRSEIQSPQYFRVGDRVSIGQDFLCQVNVECGSDVLIASRVTFVGNDHDVSDPMYTVYGAPRLVPSTATLEGDNLIGCGAIVVGSVRIGLGSIIGAGSVVIEDVPAGVIAAGVPARFVKQRFPKMEDVR